MADALEETKSISFQDMKGIGRAFQTVLEKAPGRDAQVNDIIVAQACRHAIVHAESKADDRFMKQIATANPRQLKPGIVLRQEISFTEDEIELAGSGMYKYLSNVIDFAERRQKGSGDKR